MARKYLRITMPDGSKWDVPVAVIAHNRALAYADEFGGNVADSLQKDTIPLFESVPCEINDWAANNMNWDDVKEYAKQVKPASDVDYSDGWANGDKEVVEY